MRLTLLVGAHATTLGFMAAVGRLKFGPRITSVKHQYLLRLVACYVVLGYAVTYPLWLLFLVTQTLRGHVVAGEGFLIVLSKRTPGMGPSRSDVLVGVLVGVVLVALEAWGVQFVASLESWGIPSLLVLWIGPVLFSTSLRRRRDDIEGLFDGVVLVQGFVPTARLARGTSIAVAQQWLGAEDRTVGWVADEGLRGFYERVLEPWGIRGVLVNRGRSGFWGLLLPARYAFVRPGLSHECDIGWKRPL